MASKKKKPHLCDGQKEKSFPLDQGLSSLGKSHDAKR